MLDEVIKQITKLLKDAAPSKKTLVLWGVRWLADQGLKAAGAKGAKVDPRAALKFLKGKLADNDAVIAAYRKVVGK